MKFTPADYADARTLIAQALFDGATADALAANRCQHDNEELGYVEFTKPSPPSKPGELRYWLETGGLVREYLMLQAGESYSDELRRGFITWLKGLPAERRQFETGDDMARAALVDWFLRVVKSATP